MRVRQSVLVAALALACHAATAACSSQSAPPQQQIDVVSIKSELLAIGQAERQYFLTHSAYGTLDDLEQDKLLTGGANRRGYVFTVQIDGGQGFIVTATPQDPDKQNWPTLSMDQTMQVK